MLCMLVHAPVRVSFPVGATHVYIMYIIKATLRQMEMSAHCHNGNDCLPVGVRTQIMDDFIDEQTRHRAKQDRGVLVVVSSDMDFHRTLFDAARGGLQVSYALCKSAMFAWMP